MESEIIGQDAYAAIQRSPDRDWLMAWAIKLHTPTKLPYKIAEQLNEAEEFVDIKKLSKFLTSQQRWIDDLQSKLFINCVYCGHRYGPTQLEIPREMLIKHQLDCPSAPLRSIRLILGSDQQPEVIVRKIKELLEMLSQA